MARRAAVARSAFRLARRSALRAALAARFCNCSGVNSGSRYGAATRFILTGFLGEGDRSARRSSLNNSAITGSAITFSGGDGSIPSFLWAKSLKNASDSSLNPCPGTCAAGAASVVAQTCSIAFFSCIRTARFFASMANAPKSRRPEISKGESPLPATASPAHHPKRDIQ